MASKAAEQRLSVEEDNQSEQIIDPLDPQKWSYFKKHYTLYIISFATLLADFGSSTGIPALTPQSQYWNLPVTTIQHSLAGNLFPLGAGGVVSIGLLYYFGRLPVIVLFFIIATATAAWGAGATSFDSFTASRVLNGFFVTIAQSGGLVWIQDMFSPQEYARKINIWSTGPLVSPYLGPMVSSFIIWHNTWRWSFGTLAILTGATTIAMVLFLEETAYDPMRKRNPQLKTRPRIFRLLGIEQWQWRHRRTTAWAAASQVVFAITKVPVLVCTIWTFLTSAWVIAVNVSVGIYLQRDYGFGFRDSGIFYIAGIIGVIIGWIIGHSLHDFIARTGRPKTADRHVDNVPTTPERRLLAVYPGTVLMFVATVIIGYSLQRHWHYMVLAVAYALQIIGNMIGQVGVNAYLLDAYPEAPGEVGAFVNFGRATGGFMSTYIQTNWVNQLGPIKVFWIEAAICVAAALMVLVLQIFGVRIRAFQGPLSPSQPAEEFHDGKPPVKSPSEESGLEDKSREEEHPEV